MSESIKHHYRLNDGEFANDILDSQLERISVKAVANEKQIVGVFAPPGAGKSVAIGCKTEKACDYGLHTIIVVSTINLGEMISKDTGGVKNFNGERYIDITKRRVITTPEGLPRVIKEFESKGMFFEIHVDEAHERIDSADTRPAFDNVDTAIDSKYCISAFLYSGTPDSVKQYYNFTEIFEIEGKGKKIKKIPKILNIDKIDDESVKNSLEYAYKHYRAENGQIFAFINDKTKHEYIDEHIDYDIFKNDYVEDSEILYISATTRDKQHVREVIKNKKIPPRYKMIIITSSASAGIEFFLDKPATVMVFCTDYTFNINQEIQSTIRVRTDIHELIWCKKSQRTKKESYELYENFFNRKLESCMKLLHERISFWDVMRKTNYLKNPGSSFTKKKMIEIMNFSNSKEDIIEEEACSKALIYHEDSDTFSIKESLLHKYIRDEYAKMILNNDNDFINVIKKESTQFDLKNSKFEIIDYDSLFNTDLLDAINSASERDIVEHVKDDENTASEDKQTVIKNCIALLKGYDLDEKEKIKIITKNKDEALPSRVLHGELYSIIEKLEDVDSEVFKPLSNLLNITVDKNKKIFYYKEYLSGKRKRKLEGYLDKESEKNCTPVVKKIVDDKDYKEIKKQPQQIQEMCYVSLYFKNNYSSCRNATIGKKTKQKILNHLQSHNLWKGEKFTDDIDEKIFKIIKKLFNIYEVKPSSSSKSKSKLKDYQKTYRISSERY